MRLRGPSRPSRMHLLQRSPQRMSTSHCNYGTSSHRRCKLASTSCGVPALTRQNRHTKPYTARTTGTDTQWPHWDAKRWCTKTATQEGLGPLEALMDGTSVHRWIIIDAIGITYLKPVHTASLGRRNCSRNTASCQTSLRTNISARSLTS